MLSHLGPSYRCLHHGAESLYKLRLGLQPQIGGGGMRSSGQYLPHIAETDALDGLYEYGLGLFGRILGSAIEAQFKPLHHRAHADRKCSLLHLFSLGWKQDADGGILPESIWL